MFYVTEVIDSDFQGDFVDRGFNSLEVFTILLLLKARYLVSVLSANRDLPFYMFQSYGLYNT